MGIYVIRMPDIGEGIAEVELVEWHVAPGDVVAEEQALADVMTDKANVEIPSHVAGKVISIAGRPGDVIAVGTEIIRLEVAGKGNVAEETPAASREVRGAVEAPPPPPQRGDAPVREAAAAPPARKDDVTPGPGAKPATVQPRPVAPALRAVPPSQAPSAAMSGRVRASPSVRRRARELQVDLAEVPGSGPEGRVTQADIEAHLRRTPRGASFAAPLAFNIPPGGRFTPGAQRTDEEVVQVIGLRRKIAEKMQESKRRIPHFTYVEEVDVTALEDLRAQLNRKYRSERGYLTMLPFLMRAIVRALPGFPEINARFDDDAGTLTRFGAAHIGIATQTPNGLMVPVVRNAEARDLWSCAAEVARLAEAARTGKAAREELLGSTITITSLGALGGIVTTPVINHPEVAIVGVNRIVDKPVVRDGAIVVRQTMNLSSSFDHRIVDGLRAASFVQALRTSLEAPATMFID
ncbi:MAG: 2-oxo acid dehydrogenase subunit E2 [Rhodocyclaceae bacterium]|nr:2-oxo acid dehydrogenase subunit E2 [Rhodocyclaceae bacterium]